MECIIYISIYIYMYIYYIYIYKLPHPRTGYIQGQEMFLALSADKKTRTYDKPPSLPIEP